MKLLPQTMWAPLLPSWFFRHDSAPGNHGEGDRRKGRRSLVRDRVDRRGRRGHLVKKITLKKVSSRWCECVRNHKMRTNRKNKHGIPDQHLFFWESTKFLCQTHVAFELSHPRWIWILDATPTGTTNCEDWKKGVDITEEKFKEALEEWVDKKDLGGW